MIKLLTLLILLLNLSCQTESGKSSLPFQVELLHSSGEIIKTKLAITDREQEQGLSGVQPEEFGEDEGLLFFYLEDGEKNFWMPDTYFNLDIIYLDKEFKILDIVKNLPFYKGRANLELVPRARAVWSRHALEIKSGTQLSSKLQIGDTLNWKAPVKPNELEEKVRKLRVQ